MASDGSGSDVLQFTHDTIAGLLAVRRASVTVAAGLLQKAGLIQIGRGEITILDKPGLQAMVCECYGILRDGLRKINS